MENEIKINELLSPPTKILETNTITFHVGTPSMEIIKFCENGDIFIKGKLVENDREVVEGFREFLKMYNK
tara:strand:- start:12 stop:221 length:210 start_codon:yes stop_codon:yes gene_type:complete